MNIINAIINLVNNSKFLLKETSNSNNRANSVGESLEKYVQDLFANTFSCASEQERNEKLSEVFSYIGNSSNPPDIMLKGGDAIEVKKIQNNNSALALNSSYPKQKLYSSSSMILNGCRNAESWTEKDMIYVVGVVKNKVHLHHLAMIYGMDYCASSEVYENLKNKIKNGIQQIPIIELTETNELGKLNKVDPLGITYMRIRGMWGIENPFKVFDYVYKRNENNQFNFMCIINISKWNEFDNVEELIKLSSINKKLKISDIKIQNPDNPAKLKEAKLITFEV